MGSEIAQRPVVEFHQSDDSPVDRPLSVEMRKQDHQHPTRRTQPIPTSPLARQDVAHLTILPLRPALSRPLLCTGFDANQWSRALPAEAASTETSRAGII
mgnify:FL=1